MRLSRHQKQAQRGNGSDDTSNPQSQNPDDHGSNDKDKKESSDKKKDKNSSLFSIIKRSMLSNYRFIHKTISL